MRTSDTLIFPQFIRIDENVPNTGSSRIPNIQTLANLGNFGMKHRQRSTASYMENKDIGDGHAQKETSHTT